MSANIIQNLTIERQEDFSGGPMELKVVYNSISETLSLSVDNQEIHASVYEIQVLFNLVNKALGVKGGKLF